MGKDRYFRSSAEAMAFCHDLMLTGSAYLFRGQSKDWPTITPSLFRGEGAERASATAVLSEFIEWANAVPQMARYWEDAEQLTAIAQHYGIPTAYLDLTTDPEIAGIFAKVAADANPGDKGVIYCFRREDLNKLPGHKLHEIDVANLWRLKAQKGVFLEFTKTADVSLVREAAIRVHFPIDSISPEERRSVYPPRKSALEIVIDQWMFRHSVQNLLKAIESTKYQLKIKRYTYPGAFRWREIPEFYPSWIRWEPGWIFQEDNDVIDSSIAVKYQLSLTRCLKTQEAYRRIECQIREIINRFKNDGTQFEFIVKIDDFELEAALATTIINWCWDGLRVHPYSEKSVIRCLSLTALALLRRLEFPSKSWEQEMWGETESIDTAPVGGHLDSGEVSKNSLMAAFHATHYSKLTKYMRNKGKKDPEILANYVVDPWVLFDFKKFSTMFVEEFIPSCVGWYWKACLEDNEKELSDLWAISFNPALLGFVTLGSYRFYSPIATEADVERVILVSSDMDQGDLEEVFISSLPAILRGEKPFTVKFTDYGMDSREVWQIEEAVEQCRTIVRIGGISVLDVVPGARDIDAPEVESPPPWEASGMGALHIWAIAKGRLSEIDGVPFGDLQHIIEEFWGDLMMSNQELERRARTQADWPSLPKPPRGASA